MKRTVNTPHNADGNGPAARTQPYGITSRRFSQNLKSPSSREAGLDALPDIWPHHLLAGSRRPRCVPQVLLMAVLDGLFVPVKLRPQSNAPYSQLRYRRGLLVHFWGNSPKYCLRAGESRGRVSTRKRGLLFVGVEWGQKEKN